MQEKKDFFISYNSSDKDFAEWIAWQLEEEGYSTIIQAWDFRPGNDFVLEMQKAAQVAERTIAVLSENYLNAVFTQPEWAAAFAEDLTGIKRKLIGIRIRECNPEGLLKSRIYIDLLGVSNPNEAKDRLLNGIKEGRAKPQHPPLYPGHKQVKQEPVFPNQQNKLESKRTRYMPEIPLKKTDLEVLSDEEAKVYIEQDEQVLKTGELIFNSYEVTPTVGRHNSFKAPIYDENGNIIATMGVAKRLAA